MARAVAPLDADGLYQRAVRALARRGHSEVELRRKLAPRALNPAALNTALERLREHGYLDDTRLAQAAASHQKESRLHGRARALRELQARGLAPGLVQSAVNSSYAGENEDALLAAYVKKKRLRRPADLRQTASLYRKLRLAGFSSAACQRCLRGWRLDVEWVEALADD